MVAGGVDCASRGAPKANSADARMTGILMISIVRAVSAGVEAPAVRGEAGGPSNGSKGASERSLTISGCQIEAGPAGHATSPKLLLQPLCSAHTPTILPDGIVPQ